MAVVWCVRIILLAVILLTWQFGGGVAQWLFGGGLSWPLIFSSPTAIAAALARLVTTGQLFSQTIVTVVEMIEDSEFHSRLGVRPPGQRRT